MKCHIEFTTKLNTIVVAPVERIALEKGAHAYVITVLGGESYEVTQDTYYEVFRKLKVL